MPDDKILVVAPDALEKLAAESRLNAFRKFRVPYTIDGVLEIWAPDATRARLLAYATPPEEFMERGGLEVFDPVPVQ